MWRQEAEIRVRQPRGKEGQNHQKLKEDWEDSPLELWGECSPADPLSSHFQPPWVVSGFPHPNVHTHCPRVLLTCRFWFSQKVWSEASRLCISQKLSGEADATPLWVARVQERIVINSTMLARSPTEQKFGIYRCNQSPCRTIVGVEEPSFQLQDKEWMQVIELWWDVSLGSVDASKLNNSSPGQC